MTSRRKSKRMEELQEPQGDLRRSPRLRERYSRERSEGPTLLTVTHTVTSRPGLSGYMRQQKLEQASILNESGQSVPPYFDLGQDDTASRHSGSNGEDTDALSGQPFGTPDPQHLYGLDESEDEEVGPRTRPPAPATPSPGERGRDGVVGYVVGGLMGVLFRLGSLLYLTATAILCLDVIILHRCYMVFTAVTCWSSQAPSRPWLRFWILPVVLCSLIAVLIGGGLVPTTLDSTQFNITSADLARLHSEIIASIRRSTLSSEIRHDVAEQIDKEVKELVESRLATERGITDAAIQQLKTTSKHEGTEIARLLADMQSLETRLAEMWNQSESRFVSEAIVLQMVEVHVQRHLSSAKQEWLKLVLQEVSLVTSSLDSLRDELSARDDQLSAKLSALEKLVEDNNATVTESLLQLILDLQRASASINDLTKGADSQAGQLASLKAEVAWLTSVGEEDRREVVGRLEALEAASLDREALARAFEEEMQKSVGSNTSILWTWLSRELERAGEERGLSDSGLTKKEVETLVQTALDRFSADRVAKFDFALENSGGLVAGSSETYPPALETYSLMGVPLWTIPSSPKAIIQPGVYPGDCWAMDGNKGYALIRLKEAAVVTSVTVEHIPKELTQSGSLSSAPRDFRILGKNETEPVRKGDMLGQFTYSTDGKPIQEFPVKDEGKAYTHILFDFLSNHGNTHYTCVYRVRVHGRPATSPTAI